MSNIENINLQNAHLQNIDLTNLLTQFTAFDIILLMLGTAIFILFGTAVTLIVLKIFTLTFSFIHFVFQKYSSYEKQNIEKEEAEIIAKIRANYNFPMWKRDAQ